MTGKREPSKGPRTDIPGQTLGRPASEFEKQKSANVVGVWSCRPVR